MSDCAQAYHDVANDVSGVATAGRQRDQVPDTGREEVHHQRERVRLQKPAYERVLPILELSPSRRQRGLKIWTLILRDSLQGTVARDGNYLPQR